MCHDTMCGDVALGDEMTREGARSGEVIRGVTDKKNGEHFP